jgi:hypothetical protein
MITTGQIEIFWDALVQCNRAKTQRETESIIQDAIEQYEQSKWVSVDNYLPPLRKEAIVKTARGRITVDILTKHDDGTFAFEYHHGDGYDYTVTNWMPLPEFKELRNESN